MQKRKKQLYAGWKPRATIVQFHMMEKAVIFLHEGKICVGSERVTTKPALSSKTNPVPPFPPDQTITLS